MIKTNQETSPIPHSLILKILSLKVLLLMRDFLGEFSPSLFPTMNW